GRHPFGVGGSRKIADRVRVRLCTPPQLDHIIHVRRLVVAEVCAQQTSLTSEMGGNLKPPIQLRRRAPHFHRVRKGEADLLQTRFAPKFAPRGLRQEIEAAAPTPPAGARRPRTRSGGAARPRPLARPRPATRSRSPRACALRWGEFLKEFRGWGTRTRT